MGAQGRAGAGGLYQVLNFSRMVGSRGFLSLYWSISHSRAERFPSLYSHAFTGIEYRMLVELSVNAGGSR